MRFPQNTVITVVVAALVLAGCGGGVAGKPFPPAAMPPTLSGPGLTLAPTVSGQFVTSISLAGCSVTCSGTSQTIDYPITLAPTVAGQAIVVTASIDVLSYSVHNASCNCSYVFGGLAFPTLQLVAPSGQVYLMQTSAGAGPCYAVGCAWNVPEVLYYDGAALPPITSTTQFFPGSSFGGPSSAGTWHLLVGSSGFAGISTGSASWLVSYTIWQGP